MKFEIVTPLGFTVRTSEGYWQRLMGKHPDLEDLEELVTLALASPDEIRRSSRDAGVLLIRSPATGKTLGCGSGSAFKWGWVLDYCLPNRWD